MTDTLDYIFKQPCQNFSGRWLQKQWYNHNNLKLFYKIKPCPQHRSHILTSSLKPTFSFKTPAKVCVAIASLTKRYLNNDNSLCLSPQHSPPSRCCSTRGSGPHLHRAGAAPSGRLTLAQPVSMLPPGTASLLRIPSLHLICLPYTSHCIFYLPVYNGTVGISMDIKSLPY